MQHPVTEVQWGLRGVRKGLLKGLWGTLPGHRGAGERDGRAGAALPAAALQQHQLRERAVPLLLPAGPDRARQQALLAWVSTSAHSSTTVHQEHCYTPAHIPDAGEACVLQVSLCHGDRAACMLQHPYVIHACCLAHFWTGCLSEQSQSAVPEQVLRPAHTADDAQEPRARQAPVLALRRFPGLQTAVDYVQQALQAEVTDLSGQDYGSFATLNGVPLQMQFITAADVTSGARRGYGQSCLTEQNTVYEVCLLGGADPYKKLHAQTNLNL